MLSTPRVRGPDPPPPAPWAAMQVPDAADPDREYCNWETLMFFGAGGCAADATLPDMQPDVVPLRFGAQYALFQRASEAGVVLCYFGKLLPNKP
ncbi:hypothetical protein EVG20_g10866 [Dentipellis fragilis]|uniref:Uncharacterized protein n=1 Tax=Dentipellis fragilis TaxID=205917 RepID=A0A4Y9XNQ0_9AGAM|nr:hypothetical protein EVG20_g10866 [Dentipellis fragilis]